MKTNRKNIITAGVILIVGILLGWIFFGGNGNESEEAHDHSQAEQNEVWTCSMHPQVRQPEPGQCPICGMDLIPLSEEQSGMDPNMFRMTENAMKLANIRTMTVGRGDASKEIRLNGKVEVDERNSYTQTAHIPGRIEKLMINFTGEKVSRGQTLAIVYSPELVTAQAELLQAAEIKESQPELFKAAKQKLRNWKISENQIENMLAKGEPIDRFPIRADVNGVVTELMADQGDHLALGAPIYQIANLKKLWILFDLYESDLTWVEEGSKIKYTVQSIPGKTFEGKINFIDPLINDNTRVATARIEVDNNDGKLKPGMFVSGVLTTNLDQSSSNQIVIPETAVLWTGERSVVYLKTDMEEGAGFELQEIELGPSLGDSYVVKSGLKEGDKIVVNGTFTVDAAVQLAGKPSMMNPDIQNSDNEETGMKMELPESFQIGFEKVIETYLKMKDALVEDNREAATKFAKQAVKDLNNTNVSEVSGMPAKHLEVIDRQFQAIANASDLEKQRAAFVILNNNFIPMVSNMNKIQKPLYIQHCPMADNNLGADWISRSSEVKNPYYGSAMLGCGEVVKTFNP